MNTRLALTPSVKNPHGVTGKVVGHAGQATLHWGDGSAPVHVVSGKSYEHTFPAPGRYMATCVDGSGVLLGRQQITVTGNLGLPEVYVASGKSQVRVSFSEPDPRLGVSHYRIEWPDGDLEHVWGVPGHVSRHDAMPGVHEVRLVDMFSGRTQSFEVRVSDGPVFEPDFTVHRWPEDPTGMTVYVKLGKVHHARPIHIWWDDADGPQLVQHPLVGMEIPHIYSYPGHYMQTVAYAGAAEPGVMTKSESITVPAQEGDGRAGQYPEFPASLSALARSYGFSRRGDRGDRGLFGVRAARAGLPRGDSVGALEVGHGGAAGGEGEGPFGDQGGEPGVAEGGSSHDAVVPVVIDGESDGPAGSGSGRV